MTRSCVPGHAEQAGYHCQLGDHSMDHSHGYSCSPDTQWIITRRFVNRPHIEPAGVLAASVSGRDGTRFVAMSDID